MVGDPRRGPGAAPPDVGHLGIGARADLVLLDAPSHVHLSYRPGVPLVAAVWRGGVELPGGARTPVR